jgi:tRNA threonylcarbamoyladenosine biosynthesis protein TsaB
VGVILALDTATPATAVAVCGGQDAWEARHDPAPGERPGHATRVLGLVAQVMERAGAGWADVARIAVGVGPGSFTGLRIGVATARALGQARGLPVIGVSTLRALALAAEEEGGERVVIAVVDARRGEAFAAGWRGAEERLAPAALAPEALAERIRALGAPLARTRPGGATPSLAAPPLAVGDGAVRFRACLQDAGAEVPADGAPLHRVHARHHCRLAAGREAEGLAAVLPDYLRAPDVDAARRAK